MTATNSHPGASGASVVSGVTVEELALAWRAVRSGEFRAQPQPANPHRGLMDQGPAVDGAAGLAAGPVLV
ncbi:MAG: hypothetical protein WCG47_13700, partial [Dermatophilaceae bacterium]